jgi:hypothetical protein
MCGLQPDISCNVDKVIPANMYCQHGVHHARQRYAADVPLITMDDVMANALEFARDHDNWSLGDVPTCWQNAVKAGRIQGC